MKSILKRNAWLTTVILLTCMVTGCSQQFGPQPPSFSGGIWYRATAVDSQGNTLGVQGVQLSLNLVQVLGIGTGTTTSINQQTDQSGTVNRPDAETNAIWSGYSSWVYSSFAACLGQPYSNLTVPSGGARINEPCGI